MKALPLALLLLASCARTPTTTVEGEDCPPPAAPAAWARDSGSAFTLALPPGHERVDVQGIDSEVGRFERAGDAAYALTYDYGMYGGVPGAAAAGETRCPIERGDMQGIVWSNAAADSAWYYGAWWTSDAWPDDVRFPLVMSGSVAAGDSAGLRDGLVAVGSVAPMRRTSD